MSTTIPEGLAAYLAARDRLRARQVSDALAALTPREQALVREAAVMGYVQGAFDTGAIGAKIPADSKILAAVIAACLAAPDLYPAIAAQATG